MKLMKWIIFILFIITTWTTSGFTETAEERKINNAIEVLNDINLIPENEIPPALLQNAYGIAIIPSLLKVGFIVGGRYGKGVLLVRTESNRWSNPSFIYMAGASLGYQIGAQSTDIILVFKSKKSVDSIAAGKVTLGADVSVSAGPVGRSAGIGTDIVMKAEIYSYSRSRGFFAGISLEGSVLNIDKGANVNFYKKPYVSALEIFESKDLETPIFASKLRQCLIRYTRQQQ